MARGPSAPLTPLPLDVAALNPCVQQRLGLGMHCSLRGPGGARFASLLLGTG